MRRRTLVALATVTAGGIAAFSPSGWAQGTYPKQPRTPAERDRFARDEGETLSRLIGAGNITMAE